MTERGPPSEPQPYFDRNINPSEGKVLAGLEYGEHPIHFIRAAKAVMRRVGYDVINSTLTGNELAAARQVVRRTKQYVNHAQTPERFRSVSEALQKFWEVAEP